MLVTAFKKKKKKKYCNLKLGKAAEQNKDFLS